MRNRKSSFERWWRNRRSAEASGGASCGRHKRAQRSPQSDPRWECLSLTCGCLRCFGAASSFQSSPQLANFSLVLKKIDGTHSKPNSNKMSFGTFGDILVQFGLECVSKKLFSNQMKYPHTVGYRHILWEYTGVANGQSHNLLWVCNIFTWSPSGRGLGSKILLAENKKSLSSDTM